MVANPEFKTKIKICGITTVFDAQVAVAAGADMLGFIFFPKSPRYVRPEQVREILELVDRGRRDILTVGVFVDEPVETVAHTLDFCRLDLAQLHGEESPASLGLTGGPAHRVQPPDRSPLWRRAYKAVRPRSSEEASALAGRYALPSEWCSKDMPGLLFDAYHPRLRGGTGETGDWRVAAALSVRYAILLAGGLTPANVAQAVRSVRPWGVDVASGVESSKGRKDHAAVQAFVSAVRDVAETLE